MQILGLTNEATINALKPSFFQRGGSGCRMKSDCIEDEEESIPRLPRSLTSENTLVMSLCSKLLA